MKKLTKRLKYLLLLTLLTISFQVIGSYNDASRPKKSPTTKSSTIKKHNKKVTVISLSLSSVTYILLFAILYRTNASKTVSDTDSQHDTPLLADFTDDESEHNVEETEIKKPALRSVLSNKNPRLHKTEKVVLAENSRKKPSLLAYPTDSETGNESEYSVEEINVDEIEEPIPDTDSQHDMSQPFDFTGNESEHSVDEIGEPIPVTVITPRKVLYEKENLLQLRNNRRNTPEPFDAGFTGQKYKPEQVSINLLKDGFIGNTLHLVKAGEGNNEKTVILPKKMQVKSISKDEKEEKNGEEDREEDVEKCYEVSTDGEYTLCCHRGCKDHFIFYPTATYYLHSKVNNEAWKKTEIKFNKAGKAMIDFSAPSKYYITDSAGTEIIKSNRIDNKLTIPYEEYCKEKCNGTVTIFTEGWDGSQDVNVVKYEKIAINPNDTVANLKINYEDKKGVPRAQQRLYLGKNSLLELEDDRKLFELGVHDGCEIRLELRLRGGKKKETLSPFPCEETNQWIKRICLGKDPKIDTYKLYKLTRDYQRKRHFTPLRRENQNSSHICVESDNKVTLSKGLYKYCDEDINNCTCNNGHSIEGTFNVEMPGEQKVIAVRNIGDNKEESMLVWQNLCKNNQESGLHKIHWDPSNKKKESKAIKVIMIPSIDLTKARNNENLKALDKWIEEHKESTTQGVTLSIEELKIGNDSETKKIKLPSGLSPAVIQAYLYCRYYKGGRQVPVRIYSVKDLRFSKDNKTIESGTIEVLADVDYFLGDKLSTKSRNIYIHDTDKENLQKFAQLVKGDQKEAWKKMLAQGTIKQTMPLLKSGEDAGKTPLHILCEHYRMKPETVGEALAIMSKENQNIAGINKCSENPKKRTVLADIVAYCCQHNRASYRLEVIKELIDYYGAKSMEKKDDEPVENYEELIKEGMIQHKLLHRNLPMKEAEEILKCFKGEEEFKPYFTKFSERVKEAYKGKYQVPYPKINDITLKMGKL